MKGSAETVFSHSSTQLLIGFLTRYFIPLIVISLVVFKFIVPATMKFNKNRNLAKEIGQSNDQHCFLGDLVKYPLNKYYGLLNSAKRAQELPAMCAYWLGPSFLSVHVYHPDVVKTMLTSLSVTKTRGYKKFLGPLLGQGLITSDNKIWRRHRKLLTPIFHFDVLKSYIQVFNDNCRSVVERCEKLANKREVYDISQLIFDTSFTNMMQCVMSQKATGENALYIESIKVAVVMMFDRIQTIWMWNNYLYRHSAHGRRFQSAINIIHGKAYSIIRERRTLLKSVNADETKSISLKENTSGKTFMFKKRKGKCVDFLDVLLQTKDQHGVALTDEEVKDEVVTFFSAGQETVANGIAFTLYYFALYPEIQEKCRREINGTLGNKPDITITDMAKLGFLTQCIKETMRLAPVVHYLGREVAAPMTLSHRFNGYKEVVLQPGQYVGVNIFALHRNPHVWENPNEFDPERFNSDRSAKRSSFAFIPFSAGPRNCIGQHFAMHQIRVVLAQILRRFEIYVDSDCKEPEITPGTTLSSKNGIQVKLRHV